MIKQGSKGTLCIYWNDKLISSQALTKKKTYTYYKSLGDQFVLYCLRDNKKLEDIKNECHMYCLQFAIRRTQKRKVSAQDHVNFMLCCFSLIKLKVKDEDDLFLIAPRKKCVRKTAVM